MACPSYDEPERPQDQRFVVNELLVCGFYRSPRRTLLFDLGAKTSYEVRTPHMIGLLAYAVEPRRDCDLISFLCAGTRVSKESASRLIQFCKEKNLLRTETNADADQVAEARNQWRRYGWDAAAVYHFFTRDFPFLDYSRSEAYTADQRLMRQYKGSWEEPSRFKEYPNSPLIQLGVCGDSLKGVSLHRLQDALLAKPPASPIDRGRLGTLLFYTLGKTGGIRYPIVEPLLRRTSPSGGARHPTEGYLAVLEPINDIPAGLYHYSVKQQGLEQLAEGSFSKEIFPALNTISERGELKPRAIVFYTSVVERNMWRYREPRTYRVIHMDLGHLTWTSYLVALGLGISTFAHHGMDEATIEGLFGLDAARESVYWYMALG